MSGSTSVGSMMAVPPHRKVIVMRAGVCGLRIEQRGLCSFDAVRLDAVAFLGEHLHQLKNAVAAAGLEGDGHQVAVPCDFGGARITSLVEQWVLNAKNAPRACAIASRITWSVLLMFVTFGFLLMASWLLWCVLWCGVVGPCVPEQCAGRVGEQLRAAACKLARRDASAAVACR